MNTLNICLLIITVISILSSITVIVWNRYKLKRTLLNMDQMLEAAIQGDFTESAFDESLLSAVETKLAHYLSASEVSTKNLSEEKDKIKELIADISHQTKTPLANILLYAQLLTEHNLPPESAACVIAMNGQAQKLNFLIGSLIKTSRLETGIITLHPTHNSIQPLLDDIVKQIAPKVSDKKIELTISPTSETANFDAKWTNEAIYNIIDNAVKYTPIGGTIGIFVTQYEFFCRIDINDNGIGISKEEHSKIFQRFYRSPSVCNVEGVGIGLYLTRQIITSEGGYMKVTSTLGKGSTFSVYLPRE
jgi:signal transduction histidine kinase